MKSNKNMSQTNCFYLNSNALFKCNKSFLATRDLFVEITLFSKIGESDIFHLAGKCPGRGRGVFNGTLDWKDYACRTKRH
jgi:hypothetical protein